MPSPCGGCTMGVRGGSRGETLALTYGQDYGRGLRCGRGLARLVQLADGLQHWRREVLVRLKVRLEVRKDLRAVWLAPEDVQALGEEPLLRARCGRDAGEMRARCSSEVPRVLEEEAALV